MKRLVGGLIWIDQTRFDICPVTTVMSTSVKEATENIGNALDLMKLYNKSLRNLKKNPDIIWYRSVRQGEIPTVSQLLAGASLFTFTDAGFGCLSGSYSTQAMVIAYGVANSKDTMVEVTSCLLWAHSKKIHRIARPSLACEVLSISDGVD